MVKNQIQEERMKRYFVDATKEILKGEGLKAVNVRAIAQKAGYSFATIYNYFTDAKDLVFECVKDFLDECRQSVESSTELLMPGEERIKAKTRLYVNYFVQYPGIFELFYIEKPNELQGRQSTIDLIHSFYFELCKADWDKMIEDELISEDEAERKSRLLNYTIIGLLLLYINRREPKSYTDFTSAVETNLHFIVDRD